MLFAALALSAATWLNLSASNADATNTAGAATPTTIVRVSPATQTVPAGGNVLVDIVVENAPSVSAYEFHLAFDPAVLAFLTVTGEDAFLETTGREALCFGPDAEDLLAAIVSFGCVSSGVAPGPEGNGVLTTLVFSTSCSGTSLLPFAPTDVGDILVEAVSLSDEQGNSIDVSPVGGVLHVTGAAPCAAPSTSPTLPPTATPTSAPVATATVPPTGTFTPTNTPSPIVIRAPTATPNSSPLVGDASCDGAVNSLDAALILQFGAGLLLALPCPAGGDSSGDGNINSLDAALVLQFSAGLLDRLEPPATSTPVPPATATSTPTATSQQPCTYSGPYLFSGSLPEVAQTTSTFCLTEQRVIVEWSFYYNGFSVLSVILYDESANYVGSPSGLELGVGSTSMQTAEPGFYYLNIRLSARSPNTQASWTLTIRQ